MAYKDPFGPDKYSELDMYQERMRREQAMIREQVEQMRMMLSQATQPMYQNQSPYGSGGSGGCTTTTAPDYRNPCPDTIGRYRGFERESIHEAPQMAYDYNRDMWYDPDIKCDSCGDEPHDGDWNKEHTKCSRTQLREKEAEEERHIKNFRNLYWHRRMVKPELFKDEVIS